MRRAVIAVLLQLVILQFNHAAPPAAKPPKSITNSIGVTFRLIHAGTFVMGEGETAHTVTLAQDFYIGVTEVTNAQGMGLMGFVPSKSKNALNPIEMVSWEEANRFCKVLTALPAERRANRVYRLPAEAEWEYACRAGNESDYCFGNRQEVLSKFAWFIGNSGGKAQQVGQGLPNAWGLYDMHGNVFEWCSDRWGDYPSGPVTDPQGPVEGTNRVGRGGSWGHNAGYCKSAFRHLYSSSDRYDSLGFRLVMTLRGEQPQAADGT